MSKRTKPEGSGQAKIQNQLIPTRCTEKGCTNPRLDNYIATYKTDLVLVSVCKQCGNCKVKKIAKR